MLSQSTDAHATGMQGHMYIAELGRDHLAAGDLKTLLETHRTAFLSGAFFPDSGYAAGDGYGEIAHWDGFVEAYVQWIRANYQAPYNDEAAEHIAFVMGAAAHGMADQTYDILFHDKIAVMDGDLDEADMAADVFIRNDLEKTENPDFVISTTELADLFGARLDHTVTPAVIDDGVNKAKFALSYTSDILYTSYDDFAAKYPWAASHYLRDDVPGAYPYDGFVAARYYEAIWRRLANDEPMDAAIIGSNPAPDGKDVVVDHTSMDSWITIFSGVGLSGETITPSSFFMTDASGKVVPTEIRTRGDSGTTTLQLKPTADWAFHTTYTLHLTPAVRSLKNTPLAAEYTLSFTTACAPTDSSCAQTTSAAPSEASGSGSCGVSHASSRLDAKPLWLGAAALAGVWLARRKRTSSCSRKHG